MLERDEANFLQSWNWGVFHERLGHKVFRLGYNDKTGKSLMGVCQVVKEKAKRATYLTVPGGPLIDWENSELVRKWGLSLRELAEEEGAAFVRVRPQVQINNKANEQQNNNTIKRLNNLTIEQFEKLGFRPAPMHLHAEYTLILDLRLSEEEMMKQMRKNTRREVKKISNYELQISNNFQKNKNIEIQNNNLIITFSSDAADIKQFYKHQLDLASKHGFVPFGYSYLYEQFKVFAEDNQALLISAFKDNKLLAEAYVIFYGQEAVYHYGISTSDNYGQPGAYACQWAAINEAKKRGLIRYNFWGIVPKEDTGHRFYGPSLFKRGFGGQEVNYLPAHDLPVSWKYWPNWLFELARKKLRRL